MIEQFVNAQLGHASYLVVDPESGSALAVDPPRDVRDLLDAAAASGARVEWTLDTHGHNDYLSGTATLVEQGATALAPIGASVGYPSSTTWDGYELELGPRVRVRLLHVPGHTPEHAVVRVEEGPGGTVALLTGGSLLVGDVGRPDLLGGDAQARRHAATLARSIEALVTTHDDDVVVLPTHVAGSLCAGGIAPGRRTTIGEQRASNAAIAAMARGGRDSGAWLDLDTLPAVPAFWPTTRAANLHGVAPIGSIEPPRIEATDVRDDDLLVDVRDRSDADLPLVGAVELPIGPAFTVWAGIVAHRAARVVLVADDAQRAAAANAMLLDVHERGAIGWLPAVALGADRVQRDEPTQDEIADWVREGARVLVDVRNPAEVREQPIPGAVHVPGAHLVDRPDAAPRGPLVLACASGYRARVVASVLRSRGVDARHVEGAAFSLLVPAPFA